MAKKTTPKKKRVWAWGLKGSNDLVHTVTLKEHVANEWRRAGYVVVELVENDEQPVVG